MRRLVFQLAHRLAFAVDIDDLPDHARTHRLFAREQRPARYAHPPFFAAERDQKLHAERVIVWRGLFHGFDEGIEILLSEQRKHVFIFERIHNDLAQTELAFAEVGNHEHGRIGNVFKLNFVRKLGKEPRLDALVFKQSQRARRSGQFVVLQHFVRHAGDTLVCIAA